MFLFVLIFMPFTIMGMERDEVAVPHNSFCASPVDVSGYSGDDDEDLCNFALNSHPTLRRHIDPYFKDMLKDRDHSPFSDQYESNAQTLRKIKSGELVERSESIIYEIILKAAGKALENKSDHIDTIERKNSQKYSRRKVAGIAATAAAVSTIVTSVCATIIAVKSR